MRIALAAALALAGAGVAVAADARPVVVTRDSAAFAAGCGTREVAEIVRDFAVTIVAGDDSRLAPEGEFERFFHPGQQTSIVRRSEAVAAARGANLRVISVGAISGDAETAASYASVELDGVRRSAKAIVRCASRTLSAWVVSPTVETTAECGGGRADAVVACAIGPSAHWYAEDFRIERSRVRLTGLCAANMVEARLRALLADLDRGQSLAFGTSFAKRADFRPYGGKRAPVAFARAARGAFEGWTALRLAPGRPNVVRLRVTREGALVSERDVRFAVDCRTGLVTSWHG